MTPTATPHGGPWKRPVSVLVVIHTPDARVLLLERASHPGFWQSVTGSQEEGETPRETAQRELAEETGILADSKDLVEWGIQNTYEIFPEWRHRYPPGTVYNVEHVFSIEVAKPDPVALSPSEHRNQIWLPWDEAASWVFSWSNRDAVLMLPGRCGTAKA